MRLAAAILILTGCYDPELPTCSVACDDDNPCVLDMTCGSDFHCHAAGDSETCTFPVTLTLDDPDHVQGAVFLNVGGTPCSDSSCVIDLPGGQEVRMSPEGTGPFIAFDGGCVGRNTCTFDLRGPTAVTAHFRTGRQIEVAYLGDGVGEVKSIPDGIDCRAIDDPGCSAAFGSDEEVGFKSFPTSPTTFVGWGADCSGAGACTIPPSVDTAHVSANFDVARVSVIVFPPTDGHAVTVDGGTPCTSACTSDFALGTMTTHTAAAAVTIGSTSTFSHWITSPSTPCDAVGSLPCSFQPSNDLLLIAVFDPLIVTIDLRTAAAKPITYQFGNQGGLFTCPAQTICTLQPLAPGDHVSLDAPVGFKQWNTCPDNSMESLPTCSFAMPSHSITVVPSFL